MFECFYLLGKVWNFNVAFNISTILSIASSLRCLCLIVALVILSCPGDFLFFRVLIMFMTSCMLVCGISLFEFKSGMLFKKSSTSFSIF